MQKVSVYEFNQEYKKKNFKYSCYQHKDFIVVAVFEQGFRISVYKYSRGRYWKLWSLRYSVYSLSAFNKCLGIVEEKIDDQRMNWDKLLAQAILNQVLKGK